ncbi:MAG TPA: GntR family transcriptional regulator [Anaerolineales bacterium]|nr:GntR family transcriptional regulator [Anaerolineales bacterium]
MMANFPFQRLQADLAKLIAETPAGARLMSEPDLAKQMGVSRATLREAMRTFETQGLIRRRQGSGTYVVGKFEVIDAGLEVLESLETMARRMNLAISVSDLHVEQLQAEKTVAESLCVEEAAPITRVRRVMRADSRPVAYLIDFLPETVLKPADLPAEFRGSVLDYLIECGIDMQVSRAAISATNAPADVAKALEIQRDDVLLRFASQLYDGKGTVVDYSVSYFIPGYFNFHVNRRIGNS